MRLGTATTTNCSQRLLRNGWTRALIYGWLMFTVYLWWQGYSWLTVDEWYYRDQHAIERLSGELAAGRQSMQKLEAVKAALAKDKAGLERRVAGLRGQRQLVIVTVVSATEVSLLPDFVGVGALLLTH